MAQLTNYNNNIINKDNFIDSILPMFGHARTVNTPVWNESMKMFIVNEHESDAGNRYYDGVRIADRIVIIEHIGLYHSWTFLDGIEIYSFDGKDRKLIGKVDYAKKYYDADFVRTETQRMLKEYIKSQVISTKGTFTDSHIEQAANRIIESSYRSMNDEGTITKIQTVCRELIPQPSNSFNI